MDEQTIGAALIELSDVANCAAGDFHCLHLNMEGHEFDSMHKEVLKDYYEEASNDYDELAEKARMYGVPAPNQNSSAERIAYQSWEGQPTGKDGAAHRCDDIMGTMIQQYLQLFKVLNQLTDCAKSIGVANFLQTRLEFWAKEKAYFNKSRMTGAVE